MPNSRTLALRPPELLLTLARHTAEKECRPCSEVIRDALDAYAPPPFRHGAPCAVRQLYARLNCKLSIQPVTFSAPFASMEAYREKQYRGGLASLNGLVALALASKFFNIFNPYHEKTKNSQQESTAPDYGSENDP